MDQNELCKILFLDIETVSITANYEQLSPVLQDLWVKKSAYYIEKEEVSPAQAFADRAGIYAEFGKIVAISVGYFYETKGKLKFRVKSLHSHDEVELLTTFSKILASGFSRLCAHNGKEFDYPYLSRRFLINGMKIPDVLNLQGRKPWEVPHYDTLELWKFGDYKHFTSLDLLCAVFEVPSSKSDMDGSMVSAVYYQQNDLERIAKYCNEDVIATAQVFLKLNQKSLLNIEDIEEVA